MKWRELIQAVAIGLIFIGIAPLVAVGFASAVASMSGCSGAYPGLSDQSCPYYGTEFGAVLAQFMLAGFYVVFSLPLALAGASALCLLWLTGRRREENADDV